MAKEKTVFVCSDCGHESSKWLGKCPGCNSWNSFYEEKLTKLSGTKKDKIKNTAPVSLNTVEGEIESRISTGFDEVDRVLGGGLVKGSLILVRRRTWYRKIYSNSSNVS